ncbi:hypothetical protein DH2020_008462 [Rehmannia glutinosa]|uniref:Fe2OG dioxygenase domain-containing protein n=1 Tax=Rehmannia glutinosa TaxID=99300 RepID=A0ABR0X6Q2_REHGL
MQDFSSPIPLNVRKISLRRESEAFVIPGMVHLLGRRENPNPHSTIVEFGVAARIIFVSIIVIQAANSTIKANAVHAQMTQTKFYNSKTKFKRDYHSLLQQKKIRKKRNRGSLYMAMKSVPVIDMQDLSINLPEKIVKACEEWGCFRLVNHGVPIELMSEMKAVTRTLMDLPMEIKQKNYHPEPAGKGYTPPNMASPYFEGLSLYDLTSPGAVHGFCSQIDVSPYQREVLNKYAFAVYDLAQLLGSKLMEGLGLGGTDQLFKDDWAFQLKMNKYNYGPETVGLTGAVMHSDPGFLTILQDDEIVNGLEAVDKITGELVSVDPIPGSLVVNVGDVATVWSNGRFCNVKHRVQCYEPTIRISIALFVLAPKYEKVEAPPQLVDSTTLAATFLST